MPQWIKFHLIPLLRLLPQNMKGYEEEKRLSLSTVTPLQIKLQQCVASPNLKPGIAIFENSNLPKDKFV